MAKHKQKSGGNSDTSDSEVDFAAMRALLEKHDARQKEKALRKAGHGDGVSGMQAQLCRSVQKGRGAKLSQILSVSKRSYIVPDSEGSSDDGIEPPAPKPGDKLRSTKLSSCGEPEQGSGQGESLQHTQGNLTSVWEHNMEGSMQQQQEGAAGSWGMPGLGMQASYVQGLQIQQ